MTIKKSGNWRSDFNWMDKNDVQLEVLKNNSRIEDGELGPDNEEASTLMTALVEGIELKNPRPYAEDGFDKCWNDQGVGKDIFGKYAFTEFDHEGKNYQVHIREKSAYDNATAIAQSRIIGPKVIRMKKGMN